MSRLTKLNYWEEDEESVKIAARGATRCPYIQAELTSTALSGTAAS